MYYEKKSCENRATGAAVATKDRVDANHNLSFRGR